MRIRLPDLGSVGQNNREAHFGVPVLMGGAGGPSKNKRGRERLS